jgi:hypothetical protein
MATKAPAKAPTAAPTKAGNTVNRTRRNTLERRSLSKALKSQFAGSSHGVFKIVLAAWKESRRKTGPRGE